MKKTKIFLINLILTVLLPILLNVNSVSANFTNLFKKDSHIIAGLGYMAIAMEPISIDGFDGYDNIVVGSGRPFAKNIQFTNKGQISIYLGWQKQFKNNFFEIGYRPYLHSINLNAKMEKIPHPTRANEHVLPALSFNLQKYNVHNLSFKYGREISNNFNLLFGCGFTASKISIHYTHTHDSDIISDKINQNLYAVEPLVGFQYEQNNWLLRFEYSYQFSSQISSHDISRKADDPIKFFVNDNFNQHSIMLLLLHKF